MRGGILSKPLRMRIKIQVILSAKGFVALAYKKNTVTDLFRAFDLWGQIERFTKNTYIITSTEIDDDEFGRGRVIESNRHFYPEGYCRTESNRVLMLSV